MVTVVTYNIHFGIGPDGHYDIPRICDSVRDADIIALQEVTRHWPINGMRDMVAEIAAQLPDRFYAYDAAAEADTGSSLDDGVAVNRRMQFGNMVLSRWPLLGVRRHLLPRSQRPDKLNLQRGALETLIDTPAGLLRVYSTHLDHLESGERLAQIRAVKEIVLSYEQTGGAVTGLSQYGLKDSPSNGDFILTGDFNMHPGSPDYALMTDEAGGLVDVTANLDGWTCIDLENSDNKERLDYGFCNAGLAGRLTGLRTDQTAEGSDHMPVWMKLDALN